LNERQFQFEWDEIKAAANRRMHVMSDGPSEDETVPAKIDFSKGVRGLHHIPPSAKVFAPASIERGVWEYFATRAEEKGIDLSELLTDAPERDIETNETLK
jgi:hypothetical protein